MSSFRLVPQFSPSYFRLLFTSSNSYLSQKIAHLLSSHVSVKISKCPNLHHLQHFLTPFSSFTHIVHFFSSSQTIPRQLFKYCQNHSAQLILICPASLARSHHIPDSLTYHLIKTSSRPHPSRLASQIESYIFPSVSLSHPSSPPRRKLFVIFSILFLWPLLVITSLACSYVSLSPACLNLSYRLTLSRIPLLRNLATSSRLFHSTTRQLVLPSTSLLTSSPLPAQYISSTQLSLSQTLSSLSLLQTELQSLPPYPFLHPARSLLSSRPTLFTARDLISDLSLFLPTNKSLTYLLLLQDPAFIRPHGGRIISAAFITINRGKLQNLEFFDPLSFLISLRGLIVPPPELKTLTRQDHWQFADSLWDPDFPTSAAKAAWFSQKLFTRSPDVIIAANLHLFPPLLKLTGPLFLSQVGSPISSHNFFSQSLTPSFISQVAQAIFTRLRSAAPSVHRQLLSLLAQAASSRQLLLFPLSFSSSSLSLANWDGHLSLPPCSSDRPCLPHLVYPVISLDSPASLSHSLQLNLSPSSLQTRYSLAFNPPPSADLLFRLYLSSSSTVDQVFINGQLQSPAHYQQLFKNDLLLLSFPASSPASIQVFFSQPLPSVTSFQFRLLLPNQPGLLSPSTSLSLSYPPVWKSVIYTDSASPSIVTSDRIEYNLSLDSPFHLNMDFTLPQP